MSAGPHSMGAALLVCTLATNARSEPVTSVLATGGGWLPMHYSNTLRYVGGEADLEESVGRVGRVGVGAQLLEYEMIDDECYGYAGQLATAFGSLSWRDPDAQLVHFFIGLRAGARVLRKVPSCYPEQPITHEVAPYAAIALGTDVGRGPTRLRVQLVYTFAIEVGVAVGVAF